MKRRLQHLNQRRSERRSLRLADVLSFETDDPGLRVEVEAHKRALLTLEAHARRHAEALDRGEPTVEHPQGRPWLRRGRVA